MLRPALDKVLSATRGRGSRGSSLLQAASLGGSDRAGAGKARRMWARVSLLAFQDSSYLGTSCNRKSQKSVINGSMIEVSDARSV